MRFFCTFLFSLIVASALYAQPANNDCANATSLTNLNDWCYTGLAFNGATFDIGDGACSPSYTNPPNVWFFFTAQGTTVEITAETAGGEDLKITLVEFKNGPCAPPPTYLDCGYGVLNFTNLTIGTTYYVVISKDPAVPNFDLCIDNPEPQPPVNDGPCEAIALSNNTPSCGTTVDAGPTFDPNGLPCPPLSTADVWYTFNVTAPNNAVTLTFSNVTFPGNVQVMMGQWQNGCNNNPYTYLNGTYCGPPTAPIRFNCIQPGTYHILVSTPSNAAGGFCITAVQSGPPPACAVNDLCPNAVAVPFPAVNQTNCSAGCNIGTCGETIAPNGCPLDQSAVVWHSFTTGPQTDVLTNLTLTSDNGQLQFSLFSGNCGALVPLQTCVGQINGVALAPNTTFYIAVSSPFGEESGYNFCINTFENPSVCTVSSGISVVSTSMGSPSFGPYQQGEIVRFRITVDAWTTASNNCQWLHGIVPIFGKGWDPSSFDGNGMPMNVAGPNIVAMNEGDWRWFTGVTYNVPAAVPATRRIWVDSDGVIRICSSYEPDCDPSYPPLTQGSVLPGGWFVCRAAASSGPCPRNYGDGAGCGPTYGPWNVEFDLIAREFDEDVVCADLDPSLFDCSVKSFTMADGETGSWQAFECSGDIPSIHNALVRCCTRPSMEEDMQEICSGGSVNILLSANQSPVSFAWTVVVPPGISGASGGSGNIISQTLTNTTNFPQEVRYIVIPSNTATNCIGREYEIIVRVLPQVRAVIDTDPSEKRGCASTPFTISVQGTGGIGSGYQYLWSYQSSTEQTINVLPGSPGQYTYTVTVTDGFGCTATASETVEIFPQIFAELEIPVTDFCREFAPQTLQVTTDESTIVDTYSWSAPGPPIPGHQSYVNVSQTGTYSVTITDVNGCTGEDMVDINVYESPRIIELEELPDTICVDSETGYEIDFSDYWIVIADEPRTDIWTGTSFPVLGRIYPEELLEGSGPGLYTIELTVESAYGCITSVSHSFELVIPPSLTLHQPPPFCATAAPYVLVGEPAGGTWSGPGVSNGLFVPQSVGPGTYTIYYTLDRASCVAIDSMELTVEEPPQITLDPVSPICYDAAPVQLTANPAGGTWSGPGITDPAGTFDPAVSLSGTHRVTYTYRQAACNFTAYMDIVVYPRLEASFTVNSPVCLDQLSQVLFNGVAPPGTNFIWDIQDGTIVSNDGAGNIGIRWNASGSKTISLILEISGCRTAPQVETVVVEPPLPAPTLRCFSTTVSVVFEWDPVPGATGYLISVNNGTPFTTTDLTYTQAGLTQGDQATIEVIAIGTGVCGNSPAATVTCEAKECPQITAAIDPVADICLSPGSPVVDLDAVVNGSNGSGSYLWSGSGIVDQQEGHFDPKVSGAGIHTIQVRFTEEYCNYYATIDIHVYEIPTATFDLTTPVCIGQPVLLDYTGSGGAGSVFDWQIAGGTIVSGSGTGQLTATWPTAGVKNISLTVTENGCASAPVSGEVSVEAPLSAPVVICETATTEINFVWDPVPGATGYLVTVGNGTPYTTTDLSARVDGLTVGQQVTITVIATGDGPCGDSQPTTITCEAEQCPGILVAVAPVDFICLQPGTPAVQLTASVTGDTQGGGTASWSGPATDPQTGRFDPQVAGTGNHRIIYTYREKSCNYYDTLYIDVRPQPFADFEVLSPVCIGQESAVSFAGTATGQAQFNWDTGAAQIVSGAGTTNPVFSWATEGVKTVTLTIDDRGCISAPVSRQVVVEKPIAAPVISCNSTLTSVTFTWNNVAGNDGFLVSLNGGAFQPWQSTSYQQQNMTTGDSLKIVVIAVDEGPCGNSAPVELTCYAVECAELTLKINETGIICTDENTQPVVLTYTAEGGFGGGSATWTGPGITDSQSGTFDPVAAGPGTHEIFLTYRESVCPYQTSIFIKVAPAPQLDLDYADPLCFGIPDGQISVLEITTGEEPFIYSLNAGPWTSSQDFRGLQPGRYVLRVQDANACISAYTIDLTQPERLTVDLGPDHQITTGDTVSLDPVLNIDDTQVASYLWTGDPSLNCQDCPVVLTSPAAETVIRVEVTDTKGCKGSDEVRIVVRKRRRVFIPTAFSPNGDGINDRFTVFGASEVARVESLKVFDRWGNQVFVKEDFPPNEEGQGWDGRFDDRPMKPSAFVYHAVIRFTDGFVQDYYGDVTLVE